MSSVLLMSSVKELLQNPMHCPRGPHFFQGLVQKHALESWSEEAVVLKLGCTAEKGEGS